MTELITSSSYGKYHPAGPSHDRPAQQLRSHRFQGRAVSSTGSGEAVLTVDESRAVQEAERAEWQSIHQALQKVKEFICKDGVSHTWLDGDIALAGTRARVPRSAVVAAAIAAEMRQAFLAFLNAGGVDVYRTGGTSGLDTFSRKFGFADAAEAIDVASQPRDYGRAKELPGGGAPSSVSPTDLGKLLDRMCEALPASPMDAPDDAREMWAIYDALRALERAAPSMNKETS